MSDLKWEVSAVPERAPLIQLSWRRLLLSAGISALLHLLGEVQRSSRRSPFRTSSTQQRRLNPNGKWDFIKSNNTKLLLNTWGEGPNSRLMPRGTAEFLPLRASRFLPGAGGRRSRELSFRPEGKAEGSKPPPGCSEAGWGITAHSAWCKSSVPAAGENTCSCSVSRASSTAAHSSSN